MNDVGANKKRVRYDISMYAKKAKRRGSNYQPPFVKKARKTVSSEVRVVVVILASSKAGLCFPQQRTWFEWTKKRGGVKVGFALYIEDHSAFERMCTPSEWSFWRMFLCPVHSSSAWGEFSLLQAELDCFQWARRTFHEAQWFYVVSGDSIPTKSPQKYVKGPSSKTSVIGFDRRSSIASKIDLKAPGGLTIYEHSQWKVLTSTHVTKLVGQLFPRLNDWKLVASRIKTKYCCSMTPDEWIIGSFLRGSLSKRIEWCDGVCIMEQTFIHEPCEKCDLNAGHAKLLAGPELDRWFKKAKQDDGTFALRKCAVAKNV